MPPLRNPSLTRLASGLIGSALLSIGLAAQDLPVSVLSSPNIDLTEPGNVRQIVKQGDGQWMLVGDFRRMDAVARTGIARLQADGTVDPSFVNLTSIDASVVQQVQPLPDGRYRVLSINRVQTLLPGGGEDPAFTSLLMNPTFARSMAEVDDGFIVVGSFTQVLTTPATAVARIAKFNGNGTLASGFTFGITGGGLVVRAAGPSDVVIGGSFTAAGGQARTSLARLSTVGAGTLVADWNPVLARSGASPLVEDIVVVGNAVYVSGRFDSVDGIARSRLVKLSLTDGSVDTSWNVSVGGTQTTALRLAVQGDHLLIGSGQTQSFANPPAAAINRLVARVSLATGAIDAAFNPIYRGAGTPSFNAAEGDAPPRVLIGGNFDQVGAVSRFGTAQLDAAGQPDPLSGHAEAIEPGAVSRVAFDAVNRRTYLTGSFLRAGSAARRFVLRLLPSGLVDSVWRAQTDDRVNPALAVAPGQGVFVAANAGVFRLDEVEGNRIPGWTNSFVANELVACGGAVHALSFSQLVRLPLSGNGSADPGFSAVIGSSPGGLACDALGNSVLLTMFVAQPGGGSQARLVRLDALTGAVISTFDPLLETNSSVVGAQGIAIDGDGVWVAGNFTRVNGVSRASPVRLLLADGEIDPAVAPTFGTAFNNGLGFNRGFFYGLLFTSGGSAEVRRVPAAGGEFDAAWRLAVNGAVNSVAFDGVRLILGGDFDRLGSGPAIRQGVAAVLEAERIFADDYE